jgi:hypothetical protein
MHAQGPELPGAGSRQRVMTAQLIARINHGPTKYERSVSRTICSYYGGA